MKEFSSWDWAVFYPLIPETANVPDNFFRKVHKIKIYIMHVFAREKMGVTHVYTSVCR